MSRRFCFLVALVLAALAGEAARATTIQVSYKITLAGLAIGDAEYTGTFEGDRYEMKLRGQLTGLVGAVSGGSQGAAQSSGTVSGTRLVSGGFSATAKSSTFERTVRVGVNGGNVQAVSIEPPFEDRPDRVPITDAQRRGIVDPLSGLVGLAINRAKLDDPANCNRTLPVFDGGQRFNIVLSFGGTRLYRRPSFTGNVLVCNIRYVPISGHRAMRPSTKFMADNREISVWLAPVDRYLVPVRISVLTTIGTTVIEADTWRVQ